MSADRSPRIFRSGRSPRRRPHRAVISQGGAGARGGGPRTTVTLRDPEAGHATVLAAGSIGALVIVLVAALLLTSAVIASHQARAAADLSALAAARGSAPSCDEARRVARLHRATVHECRPDGAYVDVLVGVLPAGAAARFGEAQARARAGPETGEELSGGADRTGP